MHNRPKGRVPVGSSGSGAQEVPLVCVRKEFTSLPFGISSAPKVFTKLLRPVMALLRRQGLQSVIYLGNLLLMSHQKDHLRCKVQEKHPC